jgi:hypothetical protein
VLHYAVSKSGSSEHFMQLLSVCKRLGVLHELLRTRDHSGASALCTAQRCASPAVLAALRQFDDEVTCHHYTALVLVSHVSRYNAYQRFHAITVKF